MASVENIIATSENLYELLEKARINHKKSPKARLTGGYLQTRIKCIEEYWDSFREAHKELVKSTNKEQRSKLSYFTEDKHSQFEYLYLELRGELVDTLENVQSASSSRKVEHVSSDVESPGSINAEVHLPKINLPTFSGAYEEWQSFEDVFLSLIHNNKRLSDVQKLHYLKSCVSGEAKNTIKNFPVIEKNYSVAYETLKCRYSHKRLIVDAILKKLFCIKKINTQSANQLKSLVDSIQECLSGLQSLNISVVNWDPILIFLISQKLDVETHKEWEKFVSTEYQKELPSFKSLIDFLESNIQTLVLLTQPSTIRTTRERSFHANTVQNITCSFCNKNHYLFTCKDFGKLDINKRRDFVKDNRLCYNCLSSSHSVFNCKQKGFCRICGKRHHSLLHQNNYNVEDRTEKTGSQAENNSTGLSSLHTKVGKYDDLPNISLVSNLASGPKRALLATALVPVRNCSGVIIILRALIDPGSQASFISERTVQSLRLKKTAINGTVTGVGSTTTTVSHVVQLEVLSRFDLEFSLPVKAYVLSSHVTTKLPCQSIKPRAHWSHLEGLNLADPQYYTAGKIDILLGVEVYTEIIKKNLIKGQTGSPSAQETSLGWILFGNICDDKVESTITVMHHKIEVEVDNMLRNLWCIEESRKREFTATEKKCEEIYLNSYTRSSDGRYIVKLPLIESAEQIGQTKDTAFRRLQLLERRLEKRPQFKDDYRRIIEEYLLLNHMERVPEEERNKKAIYLPHHAVIKEESTTTKIRIVFDASCKSSNGKSLNDLLRIGPQLQEDLRNLVMRWRLKPICFVTDIQKMYRMILVKKEDADLQRILWRNKIEEDAEEYRLLRVTFGTASAPYLAVKTLMQLAEDEGKDFPEAARIIKEDFYVDDCMSGGFTIQETIELSKGLSNILSKGGFILQKWASNNQEFLDSIKSKEECMNNDKEECTIKTLGLTWNMKTDSFQYQLKLPQQPVLITKRTILADIQILFDPLGWLGAAIVPAKILIQKLWIERLEWDEYVGDILKDEWVKIRSAFENLNKVKVKRWIKTDRTELDNITIHGFCDASNKAYCAVVYYRVETNNKIKTGIIASKTRVAPVKPISIPRLELCGTVLLARLLTQVREAMRLHQDRVFAWTDSSVVLSWLSGDPLRWKIFVSNRVVEILDHLSNSQWFHVQSKMNPADIGSRGFELSELIKNKLWWKGPDWLREKEIYFSKLNIIPTDLERKKIYVNLKIEESQIIRLFEDFDTLDELLRVIVYCRVFLNYRRNRNNINKIVTVEDLEESIKTCIIISQKKHFKEEIDRLSNKNYVKKSSRLKSFNPYLDDRNIIRVGGRLRNSDLREDVKHPIILDSKSRLVQLIIADAHKKTMHGGIQLMLCYIRTKFWILGVKNAVKAFVHKCIVCARQKAAIRTQIMGDLSKVRTTPARPFLHSGVDFAGPLQILMSKGRGARSNKAYITIFICMATKAIHLELVGDMSSESFIGAFRRFVSRRGRCTHIWSDQGRNFVGANKQLTEAFKEARLELPSHLSEILVSEGTQWHFIPPYSPNFGGLWEAGVKSVKYHLRRILTSRLTFEEMTTTLCQIEACLNSRPLTPVDTTDTDFKILTPGHFLIGEAPVTAPSPDLRHCSLSNLSRWQYVQRLVRDFWHQWQTEYLSRLQERPKWLKPIKEFEIGDIVLLKDEQLPPGKWSLGRVVAKHPGHDNITRVYSIRSGGDIIKRSVSKLCYLPIESK